MRRRAWLAACVLLCGMAGAEERFPPPDFTSSGYLVPAPTRPFPAPWLSDYVDLAVLATVLTLSAWLVLRRRSRRGVFWLGLFSLAYFGFWRQGCVCPIGAIQNVSQGFGDAAFVVPLAVTGFFFLPLLFALLFGRVYCAAACPHGALQEAVVLKPVDVPPWLEHALGLLAYLYLGLAVLCAVTGSAYVICEYDPFIALFRMSGSANMLGLGALFLLLGLFVGRPYCRFLCPFGALLRLASVLSRWRVKIYPDRCTDCHLCDASCPYGAIRQTTPPGEAEPRARGLRRLAALLVLLPVLVAGGAWFGRALGEPFARMHAGVRLADRLLREEGVPLAEASEEVRAFQQTGRPVQAALDEAVGIVQRFGTGGAWFGGWAGLVVGLKLVALSRRRKRLEYEADRSACVGCARCFEYCPGAQGLAALPEGAPR